MGDIFAKLCKGPVIIVDDQIGTGDQIDQLIEQIKNNKLPILEYHYPEEAMKELQGMLLSNFIVLDWKFDPVQDKPEGVQIGEEAERSLEDTVIQFIKEVQKICLAPIFVLSALDKSTIVTKLDQAGIPTKGERFIFVENKAVLCEQNDGLVLKIEEWIKTSPHIYLAKWWTQEWLSNITRVFWELCQSNPDWPTWFYNSFKEETEEPVSDLANTLAQLILSEIDVSSIDESLLQKPLGNMNPDMLKSLKNLYNRLVYTTRNISRDVRPGDIFKLQKDGCAKYYLNIRPECDTTSRVPDPELYLLPGQAKSPDELNNRYDEDFGIIERKTELIFLLLDGQDIVRFDKRQLTIKKESKLNEEGYTKICRVVPPFITQHRHSFVSFLGRFGVPSYPKEIIDSIFQKKST